MDRYAPQSILLVEDDEHARDVIRSLLLLVFPQTQIYCAGDGRKGLDNFRAYLPDIVITDINMPEMDGIEMIGNMAAMNPAAKVIVITAYSNRQVLERVASMSFDVELVSKPINFENLYCSIKRCMSSP